MTVGFEVTAVAATDQWKLGFYTSLEGTCKAVSGWTKHNKKSRYNLAGFLKVSSVTVHSAEGAPKLDNPEGPPKLNTPEGPPKLHTPE